MREFTAVTIPHEEQVLCFEKRLLNRYSNQEPVFYVPFLWEEIRNNLIQLPRSLAEKNFQTKQLVVYGIIKTNDRYLAYQRTPKGGESRLWKRYSLGVGGHVNSEDKSQKEIGDFNSRKTKDVSFFHIAVQREIDEEIFIENPYFLGKPELKCFINDDSDEVGRVHFGLVWLSEIKYPKHVLPPNEVKDKKIIKGTKGLAELDFYDITRLKENKQYFENWSQLIIDAISSKEFFK